MPMTRTARTLGARAMVAAAMLVVVAPLASAQRPHIGPRSGVNFDNNANNAFVGLQLTAPMTTLLEFYPSYDLYFPDQGSMMAFNGDVKLRLPTGWPVDLYTGGGVNVMRRRVNNFTNNDVGGNVMFGLEKRTGWIHPFAEGRALIHDNTTMQLAAGLNVTLGSR